MKEFSNTVDLDLYGMDVISSGVEDSRVGVPIITGSWAIEIVAGSIRIPHSDIDMNIATTSIEAGITLVESLVLRRGSSDINFRGYKKTSERLEYDLVAVNSALPLRRFEIKFIDLKKFEFIPTLLLPIEDTNNRKYFFRVKSLEFLLASWANRISGYALDPVRKVRPDDIEHFKILLNTGYDINTVFEAMRMNPQTPTNISLDEIFQQAIKIANVTRVV